MLREYCHSTEASCDTGSHWQWNLFLRIHDMPCQLLISGNYSLELWWGGNRGRCIIKVLWKSVHRFWRDRVDNRESATPGTDMWNQHPYWINYLPRLRPIHVPSSWRWGWKQWTHPAWSARYMTIYKAALHSGLALMCIGNAHWLAHSGCEWTVHCSLNSIILKTVVVLT